MGMNERKRSWLVAFRSPGFISSRCRWIVLRLGARGGAERQKSCLCEPAATMSQERTADHPGKAKGEMHLIEKTQRKPHANLSLFDHLSFKSSVKGLFCFSDRSFAIFTATLRAGSASPF
ncbi:unnamed protein product [Caretta caretta]